MNKKQKNKPAIIPQNQKQKQKIFADAKKRPPPPLLSSHPRKVVVGRSHMLSIPSRLQAMPPPRGLSNLDLIAICPGPRGRCMNLSYTALITACLVSVIYVCVCLPKGLRASRAGDRVCVPSASPPWCLIGCLTHTHLLN